MAAVTLKNSELLTRGLPTEFPYEDHSGTELTHLLARSNMHQLSPTSDSFSTNFKSSLALAGSTTAGLADSWDMTFAIAGQMAKRKMDDSLFQHIPPSGKGFGTSDPFLSQHSFSPNNYEYELEKLKSALWVMQKREAFLLNLQNRGNRALDLSILAAMRRNYASPHSPCVNQPTCQHGLQYSHWNSVPVPHNRGLGVSKELKKECAGTGVFIPRSYINPNAPSSRKKQGCSNALLKPVINGVSHHEYDVLGARRNVSAIAQEYKYNQNLQPIATTKNLESCLPQEWTY